MTLSAMRGLRRGLVLAAMAMIWAAAPARAQDMDEPSPESQNSRLPPGAVVQPLDGGAGGELRRNLTTLAENPRSLEALVGAGRAAIRLGDAEAANGFFTRAAQIAPDDARVKAGMASANLLQERPEQSLILFAEAVQRGAPEAEIAGDRGLAYDMVGDPRHAQQDYALALRHRADPEIERRLALSLAISGQRDAALRVIEGQLRRQDRAGWRTQAFVLALTGDAAGADSTARRLMPAPNADAMSPFFARLASLSPAQKAAAVNFGRFPSDGRTSRFTANVDTRADPGALALAQGGPQMRAQPPLADPVSGVRRRPELVERPASLIRRPIEDVAPAVRPQQRMEFAQARPRRFEPTPPPDPEADDQDRADPEPQQQESRPYQSPVARPREAPAFVPGGNFTLDTSHEDRIPQAPVQSATPGFGSVGPSPVPSVRQFQSVTNQPPALIRQTRPAMSDIASTIRTLPDEPGTAPATQNFSLTPGDRQARDAAARAAEDRFRSQGSSASAGGARYWVQIAHGSQRGALGLQYRQVHAQAPSLIEARPAWTVADRSTNRLLLGPFDDARGAQDYIDELSRRSIAAIAWQSAAGQSVDRLQGVGGASASSPPQSTSRARQAPAERTAAPAGRSGRNRQADSRNAGSDDRSSSSSSRGRTGRSAATSDDRTGGGPRGRSGRNASNDSGNGRTRSGRSGNDEFGGNGRSGSSRSGRSGADDRNGSRTRSGRGQANDDRAAHGRASARHGSNDDDRTGSNRSSSSRSRNATDSQSRSARGGSSQDRRQAANAISSSRSRSSQEQGTASSRRRSH